MHSPANSRNSRMSMSPSSRTAQSRTPSPGAPRPFVSSPTQLRRRTAVVGPVKIITEVIPADGGTLVILVEEKNEEGKTVQQRLQIPVISALGLANEITQCCEQIAEKKEN